MATIGSFTAGKDGYTGTIRTLTVNVKARIVANFSCGKTQSRIPLLIIACGGAACSCVES